MPALPDLHDESDPVRSESRWSRFVHLLFGIVAGAADLDPAAVLTATVVGATFRYSAAWVVLVTVPVLWAVFSVSSRIGVERGKGLVELVRLRQGRNAAVLLAVGMVFVNSTMIVGDILAVSDGFSLILRQDKTYFIAAVTFSVWYLLTRGNFQRTIRGMGILSIALAAYIAAAVIVTPSVRGLLHGVFLPRILGNADYALAVIALFGSLLTPDVIVWQTSSKRDLPESTRQSFGGESHAGTFVACVISLAVLVAASQLRVADPENMTTRMAAEALRPLGSFGPLLFSIGVIGSGLVALPLLVASLCFSLAEAIGWKSGLSIAPWEARPFYMLICLTLIAGAVVGFTSVNPVRILYWSQIIAGMLVIPILVYLLIFGNERRIWPKREIALIEDLDRARQSKLNTVYENFWLGAAVGAMTMANGILFWTLLR